MPTTFKPMVYLVEAILNYEPGILEEIKKQSKTYTFKDREELKTTALLTNANTSLSSVSPQSPDIVLVDPDYKPNTNKYRSSDTASTTSVDDSGSADGDDELDEDDNYVAVKRFYRVCSG